MLTKNMIFLNILISFCLFSSIAICDTITLDDEIYVFVSYSKSLDQYSGPTTGGLFVGTDIFYLDTTNYRCYH